MAGDYTKVGTLGKVKLGVYTKLLMVLVLISVTVFFFTVKEATQGQKMLIIGPVKLLLTLKPR